jgi:hypothetical protein
VVVFLRFNSFIKKKGERKTTRKTEPEAQSKGGLRMENVFIGFCFVMTLKQILN